MNSASDRPLHLRIGNADRAVINNNGLNVTGSLSASAAGGNVPHACVVRSATGSHIAACNGGEIAVGGGGSCASLNRLTDSVPWGGPNVGDFPANGHLPRAWFAGCQVYGTAGTYVLPNSVFAVCCRQ